MPTYEPQFHGTSRFRIVSRIGVGAVGELYKAMDENRATLVALRTLRNVPKTAIYGWDPGANFGLYHMDAFFFADAT